MLLLSAMLPQRGVSAPPAPIRAIYFDVGGVLSLDVLGPKKQALAKKYDIPVATLDAGHTKYRRDADLGTLSDCEFWQALLRDAGATPQVPADCELASFIHAVPGTLELLRRFVRLGRYQIGILSDDSRELAAERARILGYGEWIPAAHFIISSHHGVKKPDAEIYRIAIAAMQLPAAQILFIDDNPRNIAGARAVGMRTIFFRDAQQLSAELRRVLARRQITHSVP